MAEVKWIKIVVDIFDDTKIKMIEGLPESYAIIVAWFKLLCLAGKENNGGIFRINNKIHYTDEMLATIFRMPINTIRLALNTFENFGMIEIVNEIITIPNWSKHQNEGKLESIREYNRLAKQKERQKKRQLLLGSQANINDVSMTCQGKTVDSQDTDIDLDKDINIDKYTDLDLEGTRVRDGKIFKFFNDNIGLISPYQSEVISKHLDNGIEPELILQVLKDSMGKAEKWTWINRVLDNCDFQGVKTFAQYEDRKKKAKEPSNERSKKESALSRLKRKYEEAGNEQAGDN